VLSLDSSTVCFSCGCLSSMGHPAYYEMNGSRGFCIVMFYVNLDIHCQFCSVEKVDENRKQGKGRDDDQTLISQSCIYEARTRDILGTVHKIHRRERTREK
jgi:hypothetical protein